MNRIKILKRIHLYVSIVVFSILLLFSLHNKQLNISEISLSRLGINRDGWIWNTGLIFVAILLYYKIKHSIEKFIVSKTLYRINIFLILNLILTAAINMTYSLHNIVAYSYFLGTSVLMFVFGISIHKTNFRIGQTSLVISILSVILPSISVHLIKTLAIPETLHIAILFFWLVILEHDDTVVNLLKKFGF
jgi:hypothetical membrane protein